MVEKEIELFNLYLKDYLELWPHFCWHNDKTPKQVMDRVLFKKEFTFERWKEGFWTYKTNTNFKHTLSDVSTTKRVAISFNQYRFIPFNIKYFIT
jgi:hypothetical protein